MDPVTTSQLSFVVSRLADGVLGEAGRQAWEALVGLVKRLRRQQSRPPAVLETLTADMTRRVDAGELARALVAQAEAHPHFSAALGDWLVSTDRLVRERHTGNVNIVSGTVHGPSVQARDITGSVIFGDTGPAERT